MYMYVYILYITINIYKYINIYIYIRDVYSIYGITREILTILFIELCESRSILSIIKMHVRIHVIKKKRIFYGSYLVTRCTTMGCYKAIAWIL